MKAVFMTKTGDLDALVVFDRGTHADLMVNAPNAEGENPHKVMMVPRQFHPQSEKPCWRQA